MWYLTSLFQKHGNIQWIACQGPPDGRNLRLLQGADLVVITLRQSRREWSRLFLQDRIRFSNCVFLITDYVPNAFPDLSHLAFEFRIPYSRLAQIPYTPRLREGKKWPGPGPRQKDFRRDLTHAGQTMLRALGF